MKTDEQKAVESFLRCAAEPVNLHEYKGKYGLKYEPGDEDKMVIRSAIEESVMFWSCGAAIMPPGYTMRSFRALIENELPNWFLMKNVRHMRRTGYWWECSDRSSKEDYRPV